MAHLQLGFLLTCTLLLIAPRRAAAEEYSVEVNCWSADPQTACAHDFSFSVSLVQDEFVNERDWWTAYRAPTYVKGSRLLNTADRPVIAIHIKVKDPTKDSFRVDLSTVGSFCQEVWQKKDRSQLVFNGSNVPPGTYCWMRVKPGSYPQKVFSGILLDRLWSPPDDTWERVFPPSENRRTETWNNLIAACPIALRKIQSYAESSNRKRIVFISDDHLFLYDDVSKSISAAVVTEPLPRGVNRITVEQLGAAEQFVFWIDGREHARMSLNDLRLGGRLGTVPESLPRK